MSLLGEARQADQVAREVGDPHRLAHVEHEDLAAAAHRAGLQHELRGLRDRHEVARDLGMGDGDRAACARSARGTSAPRCRSLPSTLPKRTITKRVRVAPLQRLADHLGQPLAGAHHAVGIHRLVGRDSTNFSTPCAIAASRHDLRARDVVEHRLPRVLVLHQRHVLVRGGVEHDGRPVRRA